MIRNPFRRQGQDAAPDSRAKPSDEALRERAELDRLRPRVEQVVRERERLLTENNYTARIRALYLEGRA